MSGDACGREVLLVEDDRDLAEGLTDALRLEGYRVHWVADGKAGLGEALSGRHDLLILDAMLPEMSGFEVLRRIRAQNRRLPVLMLTAKGQEMDKVRGLRLGADDYVTKPFGLMELMARLDALLRRAQTAAKEPQPLKTKDVVIDFRARRAWKRGRSLNLTAREYQILEILAMKREQAVSRVDLVGALWEGGQAAEVSTRTVDQHIAAIRRKLGDSATSPRLIETVYGYGYRLTCENQEA